MILILFISYVVPLFQFFEVVEVYFAVLFWFHKATVLTDFTLIIA